MIRPEANAAGKVFSARAQANNNDRKEMPSAARQMLRQVLLTPTPTWHDQWRRRVVRLRRDFAQRQIRVAAKAVPCPSASLSNPTSPDIRLGNMRGSRFTNRAFPVFVDASSESDRAQSIKLLLII